MWGWGCDGAVRVVGQNAVLGHKVPVTRFTRTWVTRFTKAPVTRWSQGKSRLEQGHKHLRTHLAGTTPPQGGGPNPML